MAIGRNNLCKSVFMIDTHSHLNFQAFKNDYREVIKRSFDNGIKTVVNVGSNFFTSQRAIEIAKEFPGCYAAVGLHPIHVKDEEFRAVDYHSLIRPNVGVIKAVGEIGLDYFHQPVDKNLQKEVFLKHIELASKFDLPVILHCRGDQKNPKDAYQDLLEILQTHFPRQSAFKNIRVNPCSNPHSSAPNGVIHCFSSNWQIAQQFLNIKFLIGFTGVITFSNAGSDLLEVVAKTPLDKILIETDCPFLAPQPVRGQRCEPWHVKFTAEKIAEIKGISVEQVVQTTATNAKRLFKI